MKPQSSQEETSALHGKGKNFLTSTNFDENFFDVCITKMAFKFFWHFLLKLFEKSKFHQFNGNFDGQEHFELIFFSLKNNQKIDEFILHPDLPTVVFMEPSLLWFLAFLEVLAGVGCTSQKLPKRSSIARIRT